MTGSASQAVDILCRAKHGNGWSLRNGWCRAAPQLDPGGRWEALSKQWTFHVGQIMVREAVCGRDGVRLRVIFHLAVSSDLFFRSLSVETFTDFDI